MNMIKSFSIYFKIWFLWFDNQDEDGANFYVSIFKTPKLTRLLIMVKQDLGRKAV
jgi:predicted 3-demethylubiquinone-9 3-methyltransferase (glyoxalase superfamily)